MKQQKPRYGCPRTAQKLHLTFGLDLDDKEAEESQTADVESILGMFLAQRAQETMLRWQICDLESAEFWPQVTYRIGGRGHPGPENANRCA
jgi:hypothetical protein